MPAPGTIIGILGGGQLARMMAQAAVSLDLRVHIFAPEVRCPTDDLCPMRTRADYDDQSALDAFARAVDVATFEFENVPVEAVQRIALQKPVCPNAEALRISQDRLIEKRFLNDIGIATAPYAGLDAPEGAGDVADRLGLPAVLKTRRLGYDGKGQAMVRSVADLQAGFLANGSMPAIVEGFVPFEREISVIVARDRAGHIGCYDPAWNRHGGHILRQSLVPSGLSAEIEEDAKSIARRIVNALDYIGVLGVEFFVTDDALLVNEIAPRVHNSGHWTMNACAVSQFEQHIRCVAGMPLGPFDRFADVIMDNLIGDDVLARDELIADPDARVHFYGKGAPRPGRKMGHVNRLYALGTRPDGGPDQRAKNP